MSWNEHEIDALFKGAKAPEPPPFQESFWEEMEALLPEQPKRKRGALLWWFASGAAVLLLVAGVSWFSLQPAGTPAQHTAATKIPGTPETAAEQTPAATPSDEAPTETTAGMSATAPVGNTPAGTPRRAQQPGTQAPTAAQLVSPQPAVSQPASSNAPLASKPAVAQRSAGTVTKLVAASAQAPLAGTSAAVDRLPLIDELRRPYFPVPEKGNYGTLQPLHQERFYVQAIAGVGQSAQRKVPGASDFLHYYGIGGGLFTRIDHMVLTMGVQFRVDMAQNIVQQNVQLQDNMEARVDTKYKQVYSFETPVSIGYNFGRNTFALNMSPGFQTNFSGSATIYENETPVRSEQASGKIRDSKTLTWEMGFAYQRTLQPNWYLGMGVNTDIIRPFRSSSFLGQQRQFPVNVQLSLRRTF